jgi:branched-chain amino acid transport system permease protein
LLLGAGIGLVPAIIAAIIFTILIGILLEWLVIRPVRYPSETTFMVITIAAASILKGLTLIACGSGNSCHSGSGSREAVFRPGAVITSQTLLVLGVLGVVAVLLSLFFNKTLLGKALRATAINPNGASLVGIRIRYLIVFCFALAGGLGAVAGIVIAPITFTGYNIGLMAGMKGLVAAIMGGWTMTGTLLAGLGLGLLEGLFGGFVSPGWKDAIALLVMILFLLYRTVSSSQGSKKYESPERIFALDNPVSTAADAAKVCPQSLYDRNHGFCGTLRHTGDRYGPSNGICGPVFPGSTHMVRPRRLCGGDTERPGAYITPGGHFAGSPFCGRGRLYCRRSHTETAGLYLACATFGILIIAQIAFVQLGDLTGGHSGLLGIPALKVGGFQVQKRHPLLLSVLGTVCCLYDFLLQPGEVPRWSGHHFLP